MKEGVNLCSLPLKKRTVNVDTTSRISALAMTAQVPLLTESCSTETP